MKRALLLMLAVGCSGNGGGFPDAPIPDAPPPNGSFKLDWAVSDTGGNPISCDTVGAVSVTVDFHNRAVEGGLTEAFVCSTGEGTSGPLVPGTYDLQFHLVGTGGVVLAEGTPQLGVEIPAGATTDLTPLAFSVEATGNLALKINTLRADGNCAATGATGGNIDAMTITFNDTATGACAPVTFDIQPMNLQYTVDCTTPVSAPCIENDQTLSATDVPSGNYTIHIRGKETGTDCWLNNDSVKVPGAGKTLTETLNLGFQTIGGCQ